MTEREKIQKELHRRLREVNWFKNRELDTQDRAKDFFIRIAEYMEYVKKKGLLEKYCKQLEKAQANLSINQELIDEGNSILSQLQDDFEYIESVIKQKKVNIIPIGDINPTGGVVTLSNVASISLMYHDVKGFLNKENQNVKEVPYAISHLFSLIGSLRLGGTKSKKLDKIHEKYIKIRNGYETKLKSQSLQISYLRYQDYRQLEKVWNYYFGVPEMYSFMSFNLLTSGVLRDDTTYPRLSSEQLRALSREKELYLSHIYRFNNYLMDRLEERDWPQIISYWFADKLLAGFVMFLFSYSIYWILKILGVNVDLQKIVDIIPK